MRTLLSFFPWGLGLLLARLSWLAYIPVFQTASLVAQSPLRDFQGGRCLLGPIPHWAEFYNMHLMANMEYLRGWTR